MSSGMIELLYDPMQSFAKKFAGGTSSVHTSVDVGANATRNSTPHPETRSHMINGSVLNRVRTSHTDDIIRHCCHCTMHEV